MVPRTALLLALLLTSCSITSRKDAEDLRRTITKFLERGAVHNAEIVTRLDAYDSQARRTEQLLVQLSAQEKAAKSDLMKEIGETVGPLELAGGLLATMLSVWFAVQRMLSRMGGLQPAPPDDPG